MLRCKCLKDECGEPVVGEADGAATVARHIHDQICVPLLAEIRKTSPKSNLKC